MRQTINEFEINVAFRCFWGLELYELFFKQIFNNI